MANIKTLFKCSEEPTCYLEVNETEGSIIIIIKELGIKNYITLDVSTAIKLHKTLRTEINKAKEVNNG